MPPDSATAKLTKVDSPEAFREALNGAGTATTEVATDPRVFERITLGLYREPSAAIRELISNAYDADATLVTVSMNPPIFDEIIVEDNGIGMSAAAIDQIVHHVGGSLKHSAKGRDAGVTESRGISPGGRQLIGQMGIGLYSVARLTRHFTVETKQAGNNFKLLLDVNLSGLDPNNLPYEDDTRFVAGYANVRREAVVAADRQKSFTIIRLLDILPDAQRILQSVDRWNDYYSNLSHRSGGIMRYHIGRASDGKPANVPWDDPRLRPDEKFIKLVNVLSTKLEASQTSPSLDETLDYYLAMLWRISQSAPLKYVEKHPFSLTKADGVDFYSLDDTGTPNLIDLKQGETIGAHLKVAERGAPPKAFRVVVDDVQLFRPVIFRGFAPDERKLVPRPKMFVGSFASESDGATLRGTGYFFWSYEIKPKENNGILVRIAGASGTLFDPGFLAFRTSENLRLKQVSSEAFTETGLENALNVDRESFVDSDPSYKALQRWAHRNMTRIFTRLKYDQKSLSDERKASDSVQSANEMVENAKKVWTRHKGSHMLRPPEIVVTDKEEPPLGISEDTVFVGGVESGRRGGIKREPMLVAQAQAILYILHSWSLLDGLSSSQLSQLVEEFIEVLGLR